MSEPETRSSNTESPISSSRTFRPIRQWDFPPLSPIPESDSESCSSSDETDCKPPGCLPEEISQWMRDLEERISAIQRSSPTGVSSDGEADNPSMNEDVGGLGRLKEKQLRDCNDGNNLCSLQDQEVLTASPISARSEHLLTSFADAGVKEPKCGRQSCNAVGDKGYFSDSATVASAACGGKAMKGSRKRREAIALSSKKRLKKWSLKKKLKSKSKRVLGGEGK